MNKRSKNIGKELVNRLAKFSDAISKSDNLSEFNCRTVRLNLKPAPYDPDLVKETRKLLKASQVIFAQFLGVSPATVRDWEQGQKPPRGAACRLMDEIRSNPKHWLARLKELTEPVGNGT